jgi:hypothetical protein
MGNRGQLHSGGLTRQVARSCRSRPWLICTLDYKSRVLPQWQAGHTQLFFHDEAVALAAGHRPCAKCRRPRFNLYRALASEPLRRQLRAPELDDLLHTQRQSGSHSDPARYWFAPWGLLPSGTSVIGDDGAPELVVEGSLVRFNATTYAYEAARPRPTVGAATVLTPALTVQVITLGYRPHISAQAAFALVNSGRPVPGGAPGTLTTSTSQGPLMDDPRGADD